MPPPRRKKRKSTVIRRGEERRSTRSSSDDSKDKDERRSSKDERRKAGSRSDRESRRGRRTADRESRTGETRRYRRTKSSDRARRSDGPRRTTSQVGKMPPSKAEQQERLDELQHDLNVATEIQSNLLPKKIPRLEGYDISAYYRPSKDVGGDYYDFIELEEGSNKLGLVVADVSGKGVSGSMVMTMFRSVLRMHSTMHPRCKEPLVATNKQVAQDIKRGMFVTCMYMVLEPDQQLVRVCSAGHNPLVYWRKKTGKCHLINPRGIAIGFDKGPVFEKSVQEQMFRLEPGDRVVAYTDGVNEAMNSENEEFGDRRLLDCVKDAGDASSGKFINILVEQLETFQGDAPQADDITVLTFRYLGTDGGD